MPKSRQRNTYKLLYMYHKWYVTKETYSYGKRAYLYGKRDLGLLIWQRGPTHMANKWYIHGRNSCGRYTRHTHVVHAYVSVCRQDLYVEAKWEAKQRLHQLAPPFRNRNIGGFGSPAGEGGGGGEKFLLPKESTRET